jgi:hypothetical protein
MMNEQFSMFEEHDTCLLPPALMNFVNSNYVK